MPGHADHWQAICGLEHYTREVVVRDYENSELIGSAACRDVFNQTRRKETVACLRRSSGRISHDLLVVTDSRRDEWVPFTAFPVLHDGQAHQVTIRAIEPWQHGIEAWIHGWLSAEKRPITWFDSHHWRDGARLRAGQTVEVCLAALAYSLQSAELQPEPWPRHDSPLLPCGGKDNPDDWLFQSTIDEIECLKHDDCDFFRLSMTFRHPGEEFISLPIFVAKQVLGGYKPHLGDKVSGALWLQGRFAEARQDS